MPYNKCYPDDASARIMRELGSAFSRLSASDLVDLPVEVLKMAFIRASFMALAFLTIIALAITSARFHPASAAKSIGEPFEAGNAYSIKQKSADNGSQRLRTENSTHLKNYQSALLSSSNPLPRVRTEKQNKKERGFGRFLKVQSRKELNANIGNNSRAIGDNTLRIQELQEQMRGITGRVEQLVFELQRIQEQLRIMQEDAALVPQEFPDTESTQSAEGASGDQLDRDAEPGQGPGLAGAGEIVEERGEAKNTPLPLSPDASAPGGTAIDSRDPLLQPNGKATLGTLPAGQPAPETLYNTGYAKLLDGDYEGAEESLKVFVQNYPSHQLTASGHYWLAETYFARGQFADAVEGFSDTYREFPSSTKAPQSLLKLGLALSRLGERDAACATLAEVFIRFPDASRSLHTAARDEQVRSNCS